MVLGMVIFLLAVPHAAAEELRYASIKTIQGVVEVRQNEGDWRPGEIGMILYPNDEIRTSGNSYAEILLDAGGKTGQLEIKEKTRMRFNTLDENPQTKDKTTLLDVAIGRVMIHVQKLKGASRFEVNTPTATMGVRGTKFEVNVTEKEAIGKEKKSAGN